MKIPIRCFAAASLALLLVLACAEKQAMFVLLPDLDGNIGTMEVITEGGTQVLSGAEEAVSVTDTELPPTAPTLISPVELLKTFKAVWMARPDEPVHFLLYFRPGTSDLTGDSLGLIGPALASIAEKQSRNISVIGHADTQGSKQTNAALSLKRAERIKALLVDRGINESYIDVTSHGEEDLLIKTGDGVPEPLNRRVEIVVR